MKKGILLHDPKDDVGVAVMDLEAGEEIQVATLEGINVRQIKLVGNVPLGHKVAMTDLTAGQEVIEYKRVIGKAILPIAEGEHVHIHNLKSLRWAASKDKLFEKEKPA